MKRKLTREHLAQLTRQLERNRENLAEATRRINEVKEMRDVIDERIAWLDLLESDELDEGEYLVHIKVTSEMLQTGREKMDEIKGLLGLSKDATIADVIALVSQVDSGQHRKVIA